MKKTILILSAFMLIAIAAGLGFYFGFNKGIADGGFYQSSGEIMFRLQHLNTHIETADCNSLKNTVLDYLDMLDRNKDKQGSLVSGITYYNDKILWNTLLFQIDEKQNNEENRKKHLAAAVEACARRGSKECSEEKLILYLNKYLKDKPVACLREKK